MDARKLRPSRGSNAAIPVAATTRLRLVNLPTFGNKWISLDRGKGGRRQLRNFRFERFVHEFFCLLLLSYQLGRVPRITVIAVMAEESQAEQCEKNECVRTDCNRPFPRPTLHPPI